MPKGVYIKSVEHRRKLSELHTVYEVYEKRHDRQVQHDLQRETEICNLLSCDFIIIWDRT